MAAALVDVVEASSNFVSNEDMLCGSVCHFEGRITGFCE
jgi:hypothetical protein